MEVTFVTVSEIDIPQEIQQKLQQQWIVQKQQDIEILESDTAATTLTQLEQAKIEAQTKMLRNIREILEQGGDEGGHSSRLLMMLRFIEALKEITNNPSSAANLLPYGISFKDLNRLRGQLMQEGEIEPPDD